MSSIASSGCSLSSLVLAMCASAVCSNSGQLTAAEFHLMFASDASSPFLHHLFDVIDVNRDQSLTLNEFLCCTATFCLYTEVQMVKFAFDTFDSDGSGAIGVRELTEFFSMLDSATGDVPRTVKRVLQMFDDNGDQSIGIDEFAEMNLKYPHLLWPAFRLQYRVQELTLGLNQWKRVQRRMKERKDRLKDLHSGKAAAKKRKRWLGCFGQQQQEAGKAEDGEKDDTVTSLNASGGERKLNAERVRRKENKGKKLSVTKSSRQQQHSPRRSGSSERSNNSDSVDARSNNAHRRADTHGGLTAGARSNSSRRGRFGSAQTWDSGIDDDALTGREEGREELASGGGRPPQGKKRLASSASVHPQPATAKKAASSYSSHPARVASSAAVKVSRSEQQTPLTGGEGWM
jgi:Ca2+-binding EF-hand superfamily protein